MEFRWLTTEEQKTRTVESSSLSDVLALAQRLQAEGEGLTSDDQIVEMGRELGIRPEYVREALHLRRQSDRPARLTPGEVASRQIASSPLAALVQLFWFVFSVGMLPGVFGAFSQSNASPIWILMALALSSVSGWLARYPRLAGIAGGLAVPLTLLCCAVFHAGSHNWLGGDELFVACLLLTPLSAFVGRTASKVREAIERLPDPPGLIVPSR
jgi:hypothetical protein